VNCVTYNNVLLSRCFSSFKTRQLCAKAQNRQKASLFFVFLPLFHPPTPVLPGLEG
jgi:hypothetical protein